MSQFGLAFVAGLVTILSPCVLPMLPIVLGGAIQSHRNGPLALAAGLVISFTAFGLLVATLGFAIGLTPKVMSNTAAVLMLIFGVVLLSTTLQTQFAIAAESALSGVNASIQSFSPHSIQGQFVLGVLLGAVWTPCVGPTLGAAIALAAQGASVTYAGAIMLTFAIGTVVPLIALMYGTREAIASRKTTMATIAAWAKPVLGLLLIAVSLLILTGLMTKWEAFVLELSPAWLIQFIYQF